MEVRRPLTRTIKTITIQIIKEFFSQRLISLAIMRIVLDAKMRHDKNITLLKKMAKAIRHATTMRRVLKSNL